MSALGRFIDALIEPVAPRFVESRFRSRTRLGLFKAATAAYEGGKIDRRSKDWRPTNATADAQAFPYLPSLIARSRHAINNTAIGAAIHHAFTRNVVACGILPSAMAKNQSGDERTAFNKEIEELFYRWADDARSCDVEGRRTFWKMQDTCLGQMVEAGEIFVHLVSAKNMRGLPSLKLQLLEVDQLDTIVFRHTNGNEVRRGVEVDSFGATVAYHFLDNPQNDVGLMPPMKSRRIPAERIIQIAKFKRARQTHGVPWLAPILNKLRDLTEYDATEMFAARVAACIAIIINQENPDAEINLNASGETGLDSEDNREQFVQPGMIFRAKNPGDNVTGFMPNRPSGTYGPFVMAQEQGVAAGMNISFEELTRDASRGTYSSNRQTMGVDKRAFEQDQDLLIYGLCRIVWEEFVRTSILDELVKSVSLDAFLENEHRYYGAEWAAPGWISIDAQKENKADIDGLKAGITTFKEVYAKRGLHYRDQLAQLAREAKELEAAGLSHFMPKPDAIVQQETAMEAAEMAADAAEETATEKPNPRGSSNRNGHVRRLALT